MIAKQLSPCIITEKIDESREFYVTHFGGQITFDCGWYVNLRFGSQAAELQLMQPQSPEQKPFEGSGIGFNFLVDDPDAEHARLSSAGLPVIMPLADYPWGGRAFGTLDPNGVFLLIYKEIEASDEFKSAFK
jgi:uncharacterized glyoxalase superfamily protein PhnB